jgi:hypothetical protein
VLPTAWISEHVLLGAWVINLRSMRLTLPGGIMKADKGPKEGGSACVHDRRL